MIGWAIVGLVGLVAAGTVVRSVRRVNAGRAQSRDVVSLAEEGRRLASQRDDLIAAGVDPAQLAIPLHLVTTEEAQALKRTLQAVGALSLEEVQWSFDVASNGLVVTFLGEDGDCAMVLGHHAAVRDAEIAAALAEHDMADGDAEDYAGPYENRWAVMTEHRDDCREQLAEEREELRRDMAEEGATEAEIRAELEAVSCSCDEFGWWADYSDRVTAETPGAIAVTVWSV
jgi:hypothetical protein